MQAIATDVVKWHALCAGVSAVWAGHTSDRAKTVEPIEIPLEVKTRVGPRSHVLDDSAHRRHLENTME